MELAHFLQLKQLQLLWYGFPQGLRVQVFKGVFDHSCRSTFVSSGNDVGWCSIGLKSEPCFRKDSSKPNLFIHVFTDFDLYIGPVSPVILEQDGATVATKLGP